LFNIVTYWLKAGIVEPEETAFARKRHGKKLLCGNECARSSRGTVQALLGSAVFCVVHVKGLSACGQVRCRPQVEAGLNTFTIALRVVGGDRKGTQCLEV
jgi:hypothetical protein